MPQFFINLDTFAHHPLFWINFTQVPAAFPDRSNTLEVDLGNTVQVRE
jgi:hypothetical protein